VEMVWVWCVSDGRQDLPGPCVEGRIEVSNSSCAVSVIWSWQCVFREGKYEWIVWA
jgi:hypothetical protein